MSELSILLPESTTNTTPQPVVGKNEKGHNQIGRELVHVPYEAALRALLNEKMSNYNRPIGVGRTKAWYLHMWLRDKGSELAESGREEDAEMFRDTAIALGIVGYNKLPPRRQYSFRNYLREQIEVRKADNIEQLDTVTLSEQGRRLLQVCASALDIEYNPLQEKFAFAAVLARPEIEPPAEEDYLSQTEKAIQWENS
jgi:hypothetical protein